MIDRTHAGSRVHTCQFVRTVKGDLPRGSQGAIISETENLGRRLILVEWDAGFTVPVFPNEVEVADREETAHVL